MAYILVSNPETEKVQNAIAHIRRIYGSNKLVADSFLRDFFMNTRESGLAQKVELEFQNMTEEQRNHWLGSSDAYRIINDYIDLTKPTYKGRMAQ